MFCCQLENLPLSTRSHSSLSFRLSIQYAMIILLVSRSICVRIAHWQNVLHRHRRVTKTMTNILRFSFVLSSFSFGCFMQYWTMIISFHCIFLHPLILLLVDISKQISFAKAFFWLLTNIYTNRPIPMYLFYSCIYNTLMIRSKSNTTAIYSRFSLQLNLQQHCWEFGFKCTLTHTAHIIIMQHSVCMSMLQTKQRKRSRIFHLAVCIAKANINWKRLCNGMQYKFKLFFPHCGKWNGRRTANTLSNDFSRFLLDSQFPTSSVIAACYSISSFSSCT